MRLSPEQHDLMRAASAGELEKVKSLVAKKVDVNTKSPDNMTALHEAAANGHINVVKFLYEQGAELEAQAGALLSTPLDLAAANGHINVVKFLYEQGAELDVKDVDDKANKRTPLYLAAENGYIDVVKFLIKMEVKVDARYGAFKKTPLHAAAENGHTNVLTTLLKAGADPNAQDAGDGTAMNWAQRSDNKPGAKECISALKRAEGMIGKEVGPQASSSTPLAPPVPCDSRPPVPPTAPPGSATTTTTTTTPSDLGIMPLQRTPGNQGASSSVGKQ